MLNKAVSFLLLAFVVAGTHATELYPEGNLREIKAGDYIQPGDLVGGYPIIQNDGNWKFTSGKAYTSNGGTDPIKMGYVQLDYYSGGYLLARQYVGVNTGPGSNSSWTGTPCAPGHLVMRDKGRGRQDNCMTIDAQTVNAGTTPITFLNVVLTNSGSGGRYYRIVLGINADVLGIRGTGTGDWTPEELKAKPYKKVAIDKLAAWAEQIQDSSIRAFDFSKPVDVYEKIPTFMSLLPVPDDLVGQKRSISFVSAVEHLRHVDSMKSIAYAPYGDYKGAWGFVTDQPSQDAADIAAIAKCENFRLVNRPDTPKCEVYRITDAKRVSDTYDISKMK
ncbi:hypothetical protein [Rhodoferax sp. GW822-FHT02A01]|uniref:hypothetical protein n=1 Tax=Rhodoferax sp. GW822-FHT02A01 TaxID=3141537 RepID=UPI00315D15BD